MGTTQDQTHWIHNRHGVELFVAVSIVEKAKGLVFLAHGLSDVHDSRHMEVINTAYVSAGYSTVRWDASNSWGRSGGSFWHATATNHLDDMTDVIAWTQKHSWSKKSFHVGGFSLGGLVAGAYAQRHPRNVAGALLVSPVVAGSLTMRRYRMIRPIWKRLGYIWEPGSGWPGKRYRYELVHDLLKYDLRREADKLTMPVLIISGSGDRLNLVSDQRDLVGRIPGSPAHHVITGKGHVLKSDAQLSKLERTVGSWLKQLT